MSSIKYAIFKGIHDYPIDVWLMWFILTATILLIFVRIYCNLTDYSVTYQFIKNL
jgi:hypothetical protein